MTWLETESTKRSQRSRLPEEAGVVLALLALIILIGIANPNFLKARSLGSYCRTAPSPACWPSAWSS